MSRRVKSRRAPRARSMSGAMLRWCSVEARSSKRPRPAGARRSGLGDEGNLSGSARRPATADREPEEDQQERDQEEQEPQESWVQARATGDERRDVLQSGAHGAGAVEGV